MNKALILIAVLALTGFDATVTYRDTINTTGNVTDGVTIRNEAYPNGSPATIHAEHTRYEPNTTITHNTTTTINSYTYSDTTNYTITNTTWKTCTTITADNRTDTNTTNNHACNTRIPQTPPSNTTNTSTNTTSTNQTNTTTQTAPQETTPTMPTTQQDSQQTCQHVLSAPATTTDTIEFYVNATKPTTYWVTGPDKDTVKDKITTDNPGSKQHTPDNDWVTIHADHPDCDEQTRSVGVTTPPTEPYIDITSAELNDDLDITIDYHTNEAASLELKAAETDLLDTTVSKGSHTVDLATKPPRTPSGITTITATLNDHTSEYRVHTAEKTMQNRYPELIESTYDRKTYYGPTTVYTSLNEAVNGELTITSETGTTTTPINGSHHETTVIPPTPESTVGITITNRLGEPLDHAYHQFNLTKRTKTTQPTQTNDQNQTQSVQTNEPTQAEQTNTSITTTTNQTNETTPYLPTGLLAAGAAYAAYRARTTQAI